MENDVSYQKIGTPVEKLYIGEHIESRSGELWTTSFKSELSECLVYRQIQETACRAPIPLYHLEKPFMCSTR